jgi:hypothetical protein
MTIDGRGGGDIVEIIGSNSITLPPHTVMDVELTEIVMAYTVNLTIGTMAVQGDLLLLEAARINGTAIQVSGDVTSEDPTLEGSATVSLVGSADQTLNGPGQLPHLDISKSGGIVTVASDIGVRGNLTGSGGTLAGPGYLVLQAWDSTINFSGPVSLFNLEIDKIYTEEVELLSDLNVLGDLRISSGGLNLAAHSVTVGGNLSVAVDTWLSFSIDVAAPPSSPRLEVTGALHFTAGSKLRVDTSGSTGPSVGGDWELVDAGDIIGFAGVTLDLGAAVDAVFEDLDSLFLDLVGP